MLILKLNCFKLYIDINHVQINYTSKFILKSKCNADFGLLHTIIVMRLTGIQQKIHYIWNLTCWKDNNVIMTILFITILKMLNYAPQHGDTTLSIFNI